TEVNDVDRYLRVIAASQNLPHVFLIDVHRAGWSLFLLRRDFHSQGVRIVAGNAVQAALRVNGEGASQRLRYIHSGSLGQHDGRTVRNLNGIAIPGQVDGSNVLHSE